MRLLLLLLLLTLDRLRPSGSLVHGALLLLLLYYWYYSTREVRTQLANNMF